MQSLRSKRSYLLLLPFAPGWIIPRIVGTLAFLAHPTWAGLLALLSWWLVVPILWWIGFRLLKWFTGRSSARPVD